MFRVMLYSKMYDHCRAVATRPPVETYTKIIAIIGFHHVIPRGTNWLLPHSASKRLAKCIEDG